MADKPKLPDGAAHGGTVGGIPRVEIDPDIAYPAMLKELKCDKIDRYWLEVARRCFQEDIIRIMGKPIRFYIMRRENWALAKFPEGDGEFNGSAFFRRHYNQIRKKPQADAAQ